MHNKKSGRDFAELREREPKKTLLKASKETQSELSYSISSLKPAQLHDRARPLKAAPDTREEERRPSSSSCIWWPWRADISSEPFFLCWFSQHCRFKYLVHQILLPKPAIVLIMRQQQQRSLLLLLSLFFCVIS